MKLGRRTFDIVNYVLLSLMGVACLFPVLHLLAISFSGAAPVSAGEVVIWPKDFTLSAYRFTLQKAEFLTATSVSVLRVILGCSLNMLLTMLIAYPLSKESVLRFRTGYVWYFVFTMLFSGGMIPTYLVVKDLGLLDTIWALVLPGAVPIFNVVLMLNFFRGIPKELEEAAFMDGAGYVSALFRIYAPLSLPVLATTGLFTFVTHWNSWFDGLIYNNSMSHYPLSTYLQTLQVTLNLNNLTAEQVMTFIQVNQQNAKAAQIFLSLVPIIAVYPFLQRYLVQGMVIGGVKE
jgi:putative aldouronate transport system permease protein